MINDFVIKLLHFVPKPIVRIFANKYIAGERIDEAISKVEQLNSKNLRTSIDVLGEYVTDKQQTLTELELRLNVLDKIKELNLNSNSSIKLTSLGLGLDFDFCYENTKKIVHKAKNLGSFVRIDMEDSPFTSNTIEVYKKLREEGYDNVGLVIQAYMRRSLEDVQSLADLKTSFRLCKGIYIEPEQIAYKEFDEINANFKLLLDYMFDNGLYVGIATHDDELINYAIEQIKLKNIDKSKYELQMLLGVREKKRDEILKLGHPMRIYVSFGKDWHGYTMRRFKENPQIVGHILKALFGLN